MAKSKKKSDGTVVVAEAIGRALGMVPGTAEALKVQHPHPVDEAMAALAEGQTKLAEATVAAGDQAAAVPGVRSKAAATKARKTRARNATKRATRPVRTATARSRSRRS
jgi:hypothetical protein